MCSRKLLVTLRALDRSRCGALQILISLAQPSRLFRMSDPALGGAVLILADSPRSRERDFMISVEGRSLTILWEFS